MRGKHVFFVLSILIMISVMLTVAACLDEERSESQYKNPLKIGMLTPVSQDRANENSAMSAAYMAADEINSQGGVLGYEIEITPRDDRGMGSEGVTQARNLYNE